MESIARKHAQTNRFPRSEQVRIKDLIKTHEDKELSLQTIYRYLKKGEGSDDVAASIERAIPLLNQGVAMKSDLAIIIPDATNPFFIALWRAIANHVRLLDDCFLEACAVGTNEALENRVVNHLISKGVSGVFYLKNPPFESSLDLLLASQRIGLVLVDSKPPNSIEGVASVLADSDDGVRQAVMHLATYNHENVTFLAGPSDSEAAQARLDAFNTYTAEFGLENALGSKLQGDFSFASGERAAMELAMLKRKGERLPTAVVCANDEMARGLLKGLTHVKIDVPDTISIIGFDNTEEVQRSSLNIASVDQRVDEIAETAVRLMHEQIVRIGQGGSRATANSVVTPIVVPSEFKWKGRDSVRKLEAA